MTRRLGSAVLITAIASFLSAAAHSQAMPTAHRDAGEIRAGLAYTNANSDQVGKRIAGFSGYGSFGLLPHFSVEADIHLLQYLTPQDYGQRSYEAGGRFFYRYRRYEPYVKLMGGIGQSIAQEPYVRIPGTPGTYGLFSGAIGMDVLVPKKLVVRGEYEQQVWPTFAPNNLTPSMFSIGLAYRIR